MRTDTTFHVEPIRLWQSLCGGAALPARDHEHVIVCVECEALAIEIKDALNDIEEGLPRYNRCAS
jgi:hypothetical protein